LLDAESDESRMAGLDAASRVPDRVSSDDLRRFLDDPSPGVRAAAIRALAVRSDERTAVPTAMLVDALDDDAYLVRAAASSALAGRADARATLIGTLDVGSERSQDAALLALTGRAGEVQADLLSWARVQIERAEALHRASGSVAVLPERTPIGAFLEAVVAQRARRAEDRAIAVVVAVGAPAAGGLMRRSLRSSDQDARAQAIEALDSLGDRRLGRALSACLEAASEPSRMDPIETLGRLTQDDDRWIAMLGRAVRATLTTRSEDDTAMTQGDATSGEIETMLLLRRVPLFAGLEPEDLQRVAMVAMERDYPSGSALVREGEIGDELVVIVEGTVRVVQSTADGGERFIRSYGAGEHVGELAVLRDRPRVATVIADGDVRGLVLGGDGLRAILRERPEAAMAMLATLAERISTQ
jgi:CRP/FNR family transcriptional regulator, cyclic AMP receptor protein